MFSKLVRKLLALECMPSCSLPVQVFGGDVRFQNRRRNPDSEIGLNKLSLGWRQQDECRESFAGGTHNRGEGDTMIGSGQTVEQARINILGNRRLAKATLAEESIGEYSKPSRQDNLLS